MNRSSDESVNVDVNWTWSECEFYAYLNWSVNLFVFLLSLVIMIFLGNAEHQITRYFNVNVFVQLMHMWIDCLYCQDSCISYFLLFTLDKNFIGNYFLRATNIWIWIIFHHQFDFLSSGNCYFLFIREYRFLFILP